MTEPTIDPDNILVLNDLDHNIYGCVKINNSWWCKSDFADYTPQSSVNRISRPWRVPSRSDFSYITANYNVENVTMPGTWNNKVTPAANNNSGLGFKGNGYKDKDDHYNLTQKEIWGGWWHDKTIGGVNMMNIRIHVNIWNPNDVTWNNYNASGYVDPNQWISLRLIYDP